MKKGLLIAIMLLCMLVYGFAQSTIPGTYRYDTNHHITFNGDEFVGSYSTTSLSGTFAVSGDKLTLNRANRSTLNWAIVNENTIRDHDGDNWHKLSN